MKRSLIWFSIIYGELNALVVLIVIASLYMDSPSGKNFCGGMGFEPLACKSVALVTISVCLVISLFLSVRRLQMARLSEKQEGSRKEF